MAMPAKSFLPRFQYVVCRASFVHQKTLMVKQVITRLLLRLLLRRVLGKPRNPHAHRHSLHSVKSPQELTLLLHFVALRVITLRLICLAVIALSITLLSLQKCSEWTARLKSLYWISTFIMVMARRIFSTVVMTYFLLHFTVIQKTPFLISVAMPMRLVWV